MLPDNQRSPDPVAAVCSWADRPLGAGRGHYGDYPTHAFNLQ